MPMLYSLLVTLMLLVALSPPVSSRSFPSPADVTTAAQQRWGTYQQGFIADGCWHGTSGTTSVSLATCRAFALDTTDPARLQGFEETQARTLTYSAGNGTYWLAGRAHPGVTPPGWTCGAGTHYCWILSATPPPTPSGTVLLGKTAVSAGAVTAFTSMAPWRRTTPYVVPAGQTLVLGVCPEAGPVHLFDANESTTGTVRFGPGACGTIYPEWWGADPTGLVNSAPAWQLALKAQAATDATMGNPALACEGTYLLTETLTVYRRTNIHGTFKTSATGTKNVACQFNYQGTGDVFDAPDTGLSYEDLHFSNLRVVDVAATGSRAFDLYRPVGLTMHNIAVQGFAAPFFFTVNMYYTRLENLAARLYRQRCMEITGVANFTSIDVVCSATTGATLSHGIRVGVEAGLFATSYGLRLNALVEGDSGTPVILSRVRGIDANIYIETPGACANYGTGGVLQMARMEGGRVHATLQGNCSGGGAIPLGVYIVGTGSGAEASTRNLTLTGHVEGSFTTRLRVDLDDNAWGVDTTHFDVLTEQSVLGSYTTGVKIGNNILTHGVLPIGNQGRASNTDGTTWRIGDLLFNASTGTAEIGNYLRQATVGGNPGTWVGLLWPSLDSIVLADGDATPTIRAGNTFHTRATAVASTTAISNFDDGISGQCLIVRATGNRTITNGATIETAGGADFVMTAGDMAHFCLDAGVWRSVAPMADNN